MMKSYSQRDPLWSQVQIKGSNLTIGKAGCTISCIADLTTYFGDNLNPAEINNNVTFTPSGLVIWNTCRFGHFIFDKRTYSRDDAEIARAIKDPLRAVIFEVAGKSHWVVGCEVYPGAQGYKIADPWLGDWAGISRYANDINGCAFFRRI